MRMRIAMALCGTALALAGCGGGDDDTQQSAATPTATAAAGETPTHTAEGGASAPAEPESVLAEQKGLKARGARTTMVDLAITGLRVDGELAELSVRYSMHDPEAEPDAAYSLYELNDQQPLYVTMVDPVNLKRYSVVEDSDGQALQTDAVGADVPLDGSTTAQYTFAAPPADVTEIDVSVGDWPTFRDVPIQR
jgi:hypothetical protein